LLVLRKSVFQFQTIMPPVLFWKTPLIRSDPLSALCHPRVVFLKLDHLQASGSFKDRGMALLCSTLLAQRKKQNDAIVSGKQNGTQHCHHQHQRQHQLILISSSGGNAGLAVATVGRQLQLPVQVVVPETTQPAVMERLRVLEATVTVHGKNWNEADEYTRALVAQSPGSAAYISPYDHPLLWTGHSTLVKELHEQLLDLTASPVPPAAILVSVGGGGLICGVLEGLHDLGWSETTVVAAETAGAASFAASFQTTTAKITSKVVDTTTIDPEEDITVVRLDAIDTIATSLGALQVTPEALRRAKRHGRVQSVVCTDAQAVQAIWSLARHHRCLVEPACGAALATLYDDTLRADFLTSIADTEGPIVVEICGGSGVSVELLMQWKQDFL
jgi:L-serine/L-threonine ammonia-lyase